MNSSFKKAALCGAAAGLAAFTSVGFDHRLTVKKYMAVSDKIITSVRIALVTDLHSCRYGENQKNLIDAIKAQKPDLVLMSGDIFDNNRTAKYTEQFLSGICGLYPCYMALGNHECKCGEEDHRMKMEILSRYSVRVLSNETEEVSIGSTKLNICGIDDPTAYTFEPEGDEERFFEEMKKVKSLTDNILYTVLMSHNPAYFDMYAECGFDMVLSGHAHGGQWIIPGVLNGVLAPGQGLFPPYAGGEYEKNGTKMIVSRGLARESTPVPRFYNRPELVVIDLI